MDAHYKSICFPPSLRWCYKSKGNGKDYKVYEIIKTKILTKYRNCPQHRSTSCELYLKPNIIKICQPDLFESIKPDCLVSSFDDSVCK